MIVSNKKPIPILLPIEHESYMQAAMGRSNNDFAYELGGVGRLTRTPAGIVLGKPVLLEQEVTASECEFHDKITAWLQTWAPESCEQAMPNVDFYTWHSHNAMKTFRSSTDDEWINNYVNLGLLVTLIGNHDADWKAWIDTVVPMGEEHHQIQLPNKFSVRYLAGFDIEQRAIADRKKLVTVSKRGAIIVSSGIGGIIGSTRYLSGAAYGAADDGDTFMSRAARLVGASCPSDKRYAASVVDSIPQSLPTQAALDEMSSAPSGIDYPIRLPHNLTVKKLLKKFAGLRVFFAKNDDPAEALVSFICNPSTMYTTRVSAIIETQLQSAFKISDEDFDVLSGSGMCICFDKDGENGQRWDITELTEAS